MTALLTLEEIKAHLRVDHDADDDMLMDKVRQATAVLLAYIQGSRDKVIREDGELIPGEALTRMKGAAMRLTGMLYRNPDLAEREDLVQGELPFSVSVLIYDLRCPTVLLGGGMAISAGRLTQMISVLNPVLTRNAAGEMTEEWVSCGKIHADIRGRSSRERMQSGAEMAQAEIRIWVRGQSGREITAASRLHVLSGPWRDCILNVVGVPVPDATGGRLEILCRLGGEK